MSMVKHGGMISAGITPDSSTRALQQSYNKNHQEANEDDLGKRIEFFSYEVSLFILRKDF
jgi:hypothetical protein